MGKQTAQANNSRFIDGSNLPATAATITHTPYWPYSWILFYESVSIIFQRPDKIHVLHIL